MSNSDSQLEPQTGRVMVIALDGATWNLARPWMEDGSLPNLARVVSQGAAGEMHAELPPSSVPNWPAFMTGKNAGKHGCLWWLQRDQQGQLDQVTVNSGSVAGDTIWSYLSTQGKKVIVQNVPVTYPVEPVNGVLISGLLTPQPAQDFVYPPHLKPELDAAVGGYQIYPQGGYGHGREQAFLDALIGNIRQHTQAAKFLLDTQEWDFFVLVLGPTDEGAHKYWHYMDPSHPLHNQEKAEKFGDALKQIYTAADEGIGILSEYLTENDSLIIMSDHGFGSLESLFQINNWLREKGYLMLKSGTGVVFKKALFKLGFTPHNVYPVGKQVLAMIGASKAVRQRMDVARQGGSSPLAKVFLSQADIDWSRTRAIATGFLYSQIYINLRDRDPRGIVPLQDYEALRDELIAELAEIINPTTGQRHYRKIYRREELFSGPFLESLPDLLGVPADLRSPDSGMGFRSARLFDKEEAITGTHREEGIFAIRGPRLIAGAAIPPIRIYDIAPTILYLLGLPAPDDMDGRVIEAAFKEYNSTIYPFSTTPGRSARRVDEAVDQAKESEDIIKERLRDLGYIS